MKVFVKISRIRFWHYLIGPWLVGVAVAAPAPEVFMHATFWLGILYWSFPANLLVYGVNDISDGDTDAYNPKKGTYESKLRTNAHRKLIQQIFLWNIPVVIVGIFAQTWIMLVLWGLWLFFSLGYSLLPIRAKAKPFFDGIFNTLYYLPGIMGYIYAGGESIDWWILVALQTWVMAMHAYSAIPDIMADTKAGLSTTATALGVRGTLVYSGLLWLISAGMTSSGLGWLSALGGIVYVGFCAINLWSIQGKTESESQQQIFQWYRYFPQINLLFGIALFWYFYAPICMLILQKWEIL